ncbi:unnamed protein product [Rotaria magnacalcarata]|uniref:Uncharacterized protein n=1 Tax=Rotaria magnacalcarata TaxID=392030 RepID=A0A815AAD3_9BILA|nr:unnamed protein product [Rotaria magnacalcarata]CAF4150297.1 unnamed protein product [Rotaria magnacalcarata]
MLFCGIDDIKSGKIPSNRIGIIVGSAIEDYYLREVSGGGAEYVTNNIYSNLTLVGEGFEQESLAIVTPKQWLYGQDLDVNILFLKESGNLDNLQVK